jgi:Na+-transporting methylmalonyl-CoA/oxaloacetate decarboxylase gamma subunit
MRKLNEVGINLTEIFALFTFGFTFFIASFNIQMAMGYIGFMFVFSFLLLLLKLVKRNKVVEEECDECDEEEEEEEEEEGDEETPKEDDLEVAKEI